MTTRLSTSASTLLAMIFLLLLFSLCEARLINVTIDALFGDSRTGRKPQYIPDSAWGTFGTTNNITGRRWLKPTQNYGNISVTFNGTMIYTFFSLLSLSPAVKRATLNFFLDKDSKPSSMASADVVEGSERMASFKSKALFEGEHILLVAADQSTSDSEVVIFEGATYLTEEEEISTPSHHTGTTSESSHPTSTTKKSGYSTTITVDGTPGVTSYPSSSSQRSSSSIRVPVAVGVSLIGGTAVIALALWFLRWRRRRSLATLSQEPDDPDGSPAVTPFHDQPDPALTPREPKNAHFLDAKASDATGGGITPFLAQPEPSASTPAPPKDGKASEPEGVSGEAAASFEPPTFATEPSPTVPGLRSATDPDAHDTAYIRAELGRVRAENERVLLENELLRRVAEPPPYSSSVTPA